MSKGRNAAKTFTATRAARFADSRRRTAEKKATEVAAGTRRGLPEVVDVDDVREDDEVVVKGGGFEVASTVARSEWDTTDGRTFVRRFAR